MGFEPTKTNFKFTPMFDKFSRKTDVEWFLKSQTNLTNPKALREDLQKRLMKSKFTL